ncbi:MAG: isocitrate/isopropylmalate dehydrogenase family protein [Deltaproteobacteria bacterium]|nr:isocitrate/isopropylmalate dehydrogenase family protein [Deltaproteobacteria bacterium]
MTPTYHVVALPGDGTGPEVMDQGLRVLRAVQAARVAEFNVESISCGGQYFLAHGDSDWPAGSEARCAAADVILLGAVGWPAADGSGPVKLPDGRMAGWSPVIGNRTRLDLYANVRPVKMFAGVTHRIHGRRERIWDADKVDFVVVRENTEGLYAGVGGVLAPGGQGKVAVDTRIITREASERVIRFAFELSRRRGRGAPKDGKKRVTCIVKDNVLRGCQFFHEVFREVGAAYPDIEKDVAIVDAFTQWLIGQPEFYDVCVTTNMFGDIVTDLASVLQGGMGMAVGCNVGDTHAMFEPIHGSAPKYTGKDKVNPMAMMLATAEALRWLGRQKQHAELARAGDATEEAVKRVLALGRPLTYDLVGEENAAKMSEVGTAVVRELEGILRESSHA